MTRDLLFIGMVVAIPALIVLSAEFAGDVKRAERVLFRLIMPPAGHHSPARAVGTSARPPQGVENPAAAGGAPGPVQPGASRFPCCVHCDAPSQCEPTDNHLAPCGDGCNDPAPVLRDRMLSEVRREHDMLTDAEIAALTPRSRRPVNGRSLATQPLIASPVHPPWMTAPIPRVTAPQPVAAWDAGDGIDAPVPLARPYAPVAGPYVPDVTA